LNTHEPNQIEIWFSILSRQALKGASFVSAQDIRNATGEEWLIDYRAILKLGVMSFEK
jgi:hypothetical protein